MVWRGGILPFIIRHKLDATSNFLPLKAGSRTKLINRKILDERPTFFGNTVYQFTHQRPIIPRLLVRFEFV